jgi:hypothetical protein
LLSASDSRFSSSQQYRRYHKRQPLLTKKRNKLRKSQWVADDDGGPAAYLELYAGAGFSAWPAPQPRGFPKPDLVAPTE